MRFLKRDRDAAAPRRPRPLRQRLLLMLLALVPLLAGAGWWIERSGAAGRVAAAAGQRALLWSAGLGLAVGDVEVEGRQRASREAVMDALGVMRGAPILAVDPAAARRRLETLAWVRSAAVERRLPDMIHVTLVQREPLALWQRQGKLVLVARDGVVIPGERPESFAKLIVLVGNDAPQSGAALIDMLASEPALADHVAAAVRIGGRRWNLRLDSGIDIALPEDDPAAAWHRLAALERSDGILERDIEMVDLRLPDRLVLRTPEAQKPAKKPRPGGKAT
jgi:cell division protein FtsQ